MTVHLKNYVCIYLDLSNVAFLMFCSLSLRLDLDKWINEPLSESSEEEEEMESIFDTPNEHKYDSHENNTHCYHFRISFRLRSDS